MKRKTMNPALQAPSKRSTIDHGLILWLRETILQPVMDEMTHGWKMSDTDARSFFEDRPRIAKDSMVAGDILSYALSQIGVAHGPKGANEMRLRMLHGFGPISYAAAVANHAESMGVEDSPFWILGAEYALDVVVRLVWPDPNSKPPELERYRESPGRRCGIFPEVARHYENIEHLRAAARARSAAKVPA